MQRDPGVEQPVARSAETGAILVAQVAERHERRDAGRPAAGAGRRARTTRIGTERPADPARRLHVAQPAAAVLEVGCQHLRDRPGLRQPGAAPEDRSSMRRFRRLGASRRTLLIMSSSSSSSPASKRVSSSEVRASSSESARLSASFTVRAEWPSTKPASQSGYHSRELVPERGCAATTAVQQHHVDVGPRTQLAARVRPERHQRPTAARAEPGAGVDQRVVDHVAQRAAECRAAEARGLDQLVGERAERAAHLVTPVRYSASEPASPVRMRHALLDRHDPDLAVTDLAGTGGLDQTAATTRSTSPSSTRISIRTFGTKSIVYSAPRYTSVWPRWRPKPWTSDTVSPGHRAP